MWHRQLLRIVHRLGARHFVLRDGNVVRTTKEKASQREISVSYDSDSVEARSGAHVERRPLPVPPRLGSDRRKINRKLNDIDPKRLLSTARRCQVSGLLSVYGEERLVYPSPDSDAKRQSMQFWVINILEGKGSLLYSGRSYQSFEWLCRLRSLPERPLHGSESSIVFGSDVVGNLFHEFVHLLETDLLTRGDMSKILGEKVFPAAVEVTENPLKPTVGYNAFSDEGVSAAAQLVKDGRIASFLDCACFPYQKSAFGYVGYGSDLVPKPRSTNLVIEAAHEAVAPDNFLMLTGIDFTMKAMDPLESECCLNGVTGVYVEEGRPKFRFRSTSSLGTTIQNLVSELAFTRLGLVAPPLGGMCVKYGAAVRSAQSAPSALFKGASGERKKLLQL